MNKRRLILGLVCVTIAACMVTACSKDKPSGNTNVGSRPVATAGMQEQQTVSNMRVFIKDITAYAGEDIDYIGAIESAENLEINRSMIYVDSSAVDSNTPGTYMAIYTLDYLGSSVSNSVKVTILENPKKETTTAPVETATEIATETAPAETTSGEETAGEQETASSDATGEGSTDNTGAETSGETQTVSSTEPITAIVEQELPAAEITLSSGRVVSFKMTSARYITETYTVDTYFEEDGMTFLNSELRVVFNTGEEQVVETVVTRVQPQSTTATTE